jgi:prolyl 4-hydroxylase
VRKSEKAGLNATDSTVACVSERARRFQGFRPGVFVEQMWSQRYARNGHYMYHYDYSNPTATSGRVSSFMVYLDANCTGGGTNFPRLERPSGSDWCRFVECGEGSEVLRDGKGEEVRGTTFKAIKGNAVFWENLRSDGSGYPETYHAGLPVREGVKVGLNIWSWFEEGYRGS